jgi:hypothetical protein
LAVSTNSTEAQVFLEVTVKMFQHTIEVPVYNDVSCSYQLSFVKLFPQLLSYFTGLGARA